MRKILTSLFAAGFALCTSTAHAQTGDISLAGGASFFDGSTLIGGSIWPKINVSENVQIGAILGYFADKENGFAVEITTTAIPIFGTVTYNIGDVTAPHPFVGAGIGGYSIGVEAEVAGVSASDTEFFFGAGLHGGVNIPLGETVLIQVRTGVDLFFVTEDQEIGRESSTEVAVPLVAGIGFRF